MENQPLTELHSSSQEMQSSSESISQNRLSLPIIIGVLALLLIVGVGAYNLGKREGISSQSAPTTVTQTKQEASPEPTAQSTNKTPSAEPTVEPVSNLRTYTNQAYNFSVQYPEGWEVSTIGASKFKKTELLFSLQKKDPRYANCKSEGPCENFADIQFRVGMTDQTVKDFDFAFWGSGSLTEKKNITKINGVEVLHAYNTSSSPFPDSSLFKVSPTLQLYVRAEFFNYNDQNNESSYSKETILEINKILSSVKFRE